MIEQYINTHAVRKLQLGCGGNFLDGWLNTDITIYDQTKATYMDATQPFPIPDNSFDYVYSEHNIEHVDYWAGQRMLQESHRILKPGGKIRISCPDFQFLVDIYTKPAILHDKYVAETIPSWAPYADPIFTVNNYVRDWGHKFIYDKRSLTASLEAAGFVDVTEHKIQESQDQNLAGLEIASRMPEGFLQLESMTFEAVKSST